MVYWYKSIHMTSHITMCLFLTVVSTALTAVDGTCVEVLSCALSTTQPWGPKVMMTAVQPRLRSS